MENNIISELKNIKITEVADKLGIMTKFNIDPERLTGDCVTGHSSQNHHCFGLVPNGNYFHCFNCGIAGDVIQLVMLTLNIEFPAALNWLAENFNPALLKLISIEHTENYFNAERTIEFIRSKLYEDVLQFGRKLLFEEPGRKALEYLTVNRKYDPELLKNTEWFYMPPTIEIQKFLLSTYSESGPATKKQISELPLNGYFGDNFRIAFPYRDRHGKITGLVKRAIEPSGIDIITFDEKEHKNIRWDSTKGLKKDDLFNLCHCKRQQELIILEGYPDALYFSAIGHKNIVAIGQGNISGKCLEGLKNFKVKKVIIAYDNDKPKEDGKITGLENTEKTVDMLIKEPDIEIFVCDPRKMKSLNNPSKHVKDPDEFLAENGTEALKSFFKNEPVSATKWKADRLAEKYNPKNDQTKQVFFEESIKFRLNMKNRKLRDHIDFLEEISKISGYPVVVIEEEFERARKKMSEETKIREMNKIIYENRTQNNLNSLIDKLSKLKSSYTESEFEEPAFDFTQTLNETLNEEITGYKTGFEVFDGSDDEPQYRLSTDGPTIIAGNSGVGKTTTMLNIFLNMIDEYPDKAFIFFTYEESAGALLFKLLNITAKVVFNKESNLRSIKEHMKRNDRSSWNSEIYRAFQKLKLQAENKRLWIIDKEYDVDELVSTIKALKNKHDIGAVFIDYIQKLRIKKEFLNNQLRLQKISEIIRSQTKGLNISVIIGSQLNKDGQIREAMDIFHDANLVLKVDEVTKAQYSWHIKKTLSKKEEKDKIVEGYRMLIIEKGREIASHKEMMLKFNGENLLLKDIRSDAIFTRSDDEIVDKFDASDF